MGDQFQSLAGLFAEHASGSRAPLEFSISEWLDGASKDAKMYQSSHAALVEVLGKPELVNTRDSERLSRMFQNRVIRVFKRFENEFFGMWDTIEKIYSYALRAAQGLDERHKILYLFGPVGGGKSSLAEKIKSMMEEAPFWTLAFVDGSGKRELSPVFESPLGLFTLPGMKAKVGEKFNIDERAFPRLMSPWAAKRLLETNYDVSRFRAVRLYPSVVNQIGIAVATPGDETNQDTSVLVGKVDIRKVADFSPSDTDAYDYSGSLCRGQRVMEFVEMFKAPIKTLNPLLPATMENYFNGSEAIGGIPFHGIILAHSNEAEWDKFSKDKRNEAFLDRISLVEVPYVLSVDEEVRIYKKLIDQSALAKAPIAPGTYELLANFFVLSRLKEAENSTLLSKLRVYNGENLKDTDPKAKPIHEYRAGAGVDEGMDGLSTRFAFEVLAKTFNAYPGEIGADAVHLLTVLEKEIRQKKFGDALQGKYIDKFLKEICCKALFERLEKDISKCYIANSDGYGQALYDRYVMHANHWLDDCDYVDPETNQVWSKADLNAELEKLEKAAGIANPKEFRSEATRHFAKHLAEKGKRPHWREYKKIETVLEKIIFSNMKDMIGIISFAEKKTHEDAEEHKKFLEHMIALGYTETMVKRAVEWYTRAKK